MTPTARAWIDEIFARVGQLEQFPESGRIVPKVGKSGIREILFGNYRIIYSVRGRPIPVRTVRYVKQRSSMR